VDSPWPKPKAQFDDLRSFLSALEAEGELKRIDTAVNPELEITEISRRTLARNGPALLFTQPAGSEIPILANLFGTQERIATALGTTAPDGFRRLGQLLAALRAPEAPKGIGDAWQKLPLIREILKMAPRTSKSGPCQEIVIEGDAVDLSMWPIQTCWPDDAGPLITWGLTTTRGPLSDRQNLGVYRQQVVGRNRIIMRWLAHRGGATDYAAWRTRHPNDPFPVAVTIGADPATLLAAVTPIPDTISEYAFAIVAIGTR
jgi:4-hydroxy-3-polyprenylbenzoate decarboxylase